MNQYKEIYEEAHVLSAWGFACLWLVPREKRPVALKWTQAPRYSWNELKTLYQSENNLGVRLGEPSLVKGAYLHALDLDIRKESHAEEAYKVLNELLGNANINLDDLGSVISGSGGKSKHYYILLDKPTASKKIKHSEESFIDDKGKKHWYWELDLKGTGTQIVLPPSIHPVTGKTYDWEYGEDVNDWKIYPTSSLVDIVSSDNFDIYDSKNAVDVDPLMVLSKKLNITIEEAKAKLDNSLRDMLDVDDYNSYFLIGGALHFEFDGSLEARELWKDWAKQSTKYDEKDADYKWSTFGKRTDKTKDIGLRSIFKREAVEEIIYESIFERVEKAATAEIALKVIGNSEDLTSLQIIKLTEIVRKRFKEEDSLTLSSAQINKMLGEQKFTKSLAKGESDTLWFDSWLAKATLTRYYDKGKKLIFTNKMFYAFRKGAWTKYDASIIKLKISDFLEEVIANENSQYADLKAKLISSNREDIGKTISSVLNMIEVFSSRLGGDDPLGKAKPFHEAVFNCANKEIVVNESGILERKHDPMTLSDVVLTVKYEPGAASPLFDKLLKDIFGHRPDYKEVVDHFYEIIGYMLQGTRTVPLFVLFKGKGANGKTVILDVVSAMLGVNAVCVQSISDFGSHKDNHIYAQLVGKRLVVDKDFGVNAEWPDAFLKGLDGNLTANEKWGQPFTFYNRAVPLIASNHWPKTSDGSIGMARRAMVFEFEKIIPVEQQDILLTKKIIEHELPGILNKAIEGYSRFVARGRFHEPQSCVIAKSNWLKNTSPFKNFADEHLILNEKESCKMFDVWQAYQSWAMENNVKFLPTKQNFYQSVLDLPGVAKSTKRHRELFFSGLKLNFTPYNDVFDLYDNDDEL